MQKIVHKHKGLGEIGTTGTPLVVSYEISEYREVLPAGSLDDHNAITEGTGVIEGMFWTLDDSPLPSSRPDLILTLADGRRLKILNYAKFGSKRGGTGLRRLHLKPQKLKKRLLP